VRARRLLIFKFLRQKIMFRSRASCRYLPRSALLFLGQLTDSALWDAELAADPQQLADRLARMPDPRAVQGGGSRWVW
jgi:hypothetical protein